MIYPWLPCSEMRNMNKASKCGKGLWIEFGAGQDVPKLVVINGSRCKYFGTSGKLDLNHSSLDFPNTIPSRICPICFRQRILHQY